jgi:NADH:ubiquinone oxidoreductase subunit 5 (subunit L)/multisubunit Na+/H+ antiporter MnhA subunit
MDTLRILLIGTLVGAPLMACGLSVLEGLLTRRAILTIALLTAVTVLLNAIGLFFISSLHPKAIIAVRLGTWLSVPGFNVEWGARVDDFAIIQTALVAAVLLLVLSAWPDKVSLRWLMLAWFGVTLANVASNIGQIFVGWILSAWASSELARQPDKALRPIWLVQRVSDIALLTGFGIAWMHFDSTLEFTAWTQRAIGALRPELIESMVLCIFIGVIGRCAQLPLTVWLETEHGFAAQSGNSMSKLSDVMVGVWNVPDGHEVAERLKADRANRWHEPSDDSVPSAVQAWWLCAAFLPMGVGLLVRFEPLFVVASHTRLLMVAVGAFTLLMCSANAAAQTNWPRVLSQFAVGQCGLVLIAMGIGNHSTGFLGVSTFLWQSVLIAVLLVSSAAIRRWGTGLMTVAMSLIVAGVCGRHALADGIWEHARQLFEMALHMSDEAEGVVLGATETRLWWLVLGTIFLAEFLTGFALIRAWQLSRREGIARSLVGPNRRLYVVLWTATLFVLCGSLLSWSRVTPMSDEGGQLSEFKFSWTPPQLLGAVPLLPVSLAGAVLAWWMYSVPSSMPDKVSAAMGPFARLARNRFYWDDLYYLVVVHPTTVIGETLVSLERSVFGRGAIALLNRAANAVGESAEPLARGPAMIGALTTVGSVAVLAWMLLWLRS